MATATLMMPVEVSLNGVRLKRKKIFEISNGSKKEMMTQDVDFWASAIVTGTNTADGMQACSEERSYYGNLFRSVNVKLSDGAIHSVIFKINRDAATKLKIGKSYNFEGVELAPSPRVLRNKEGKVTATLAPRRMLECYNVVKGALTVKDTGEYQE